MDEEALAALAFGPDAGSADPIPRDGSPRQRLLAAIVLGARGRYAAAAELLDPLRRGRDPLTASLAASTLASHRRQLGAHVAARKLDGEALLAVGLRGAVELRAHRPGAEGARVSGPAAAEMRQSDPSAVRLRGGRSGAADRGQSGSGEAGLRERGAGSVDDSADGAVAPGRGSAGTRPDSAAPRSASTSTGRRAAAADSPRSAPALPAAPGSAAVDPGGPGLRGAGADVDSSRSVRARAAAPGSAAVDPGGPGLRGARADAGSSPPAQPPRAALSSAAEDPHGPGLRDARADTDSSRSVRARAAAPDSTAEDRRGSGLRGAQAEADSSRSVQSRPAAPSPATEDPHGLDLPGARADALLGLAADNLALGRISAARRLAVRAAQADRRWRATVRGGWVGAEIELADGQPDAAVAPARLAYETAVARCARRHTVKSGIVLGVALLSAGQDGARELLVAAAEDAEKHELYSLSWVADRVAADVDHDRAEEYRFRSRQVLHAVLRHADPCVMRVAHESPWVPVGPG